MEEIDLKELFKIFWNRRLQIILIVAIFIVLGLIYTIGFVTPKYSSSTTLVLASQNSNASSAHDSSITATDITVNSKLVATYSDIATSKSVVRKVISNLDIDIDEEELKKNIKVASVADTEIIKITVSNEDKYKAEKIANEMSKVFIERVKEIYKIDNVQILDTAEVEDIPSNINHKRDIAIFAVIGLAIAACYVFILYMMDTTIKTAEDIETMCQLPVLASIPLYEEEMQKSKKGGRR